MLATLSFDFDPVVVLSETASVRLETIALAIVLFIGLVLAARIASLTPAAPPGSPPNEPRAPGSLRLDDMVFIVVGAVPGAIVGGRLGYVLDHLAYYQATPAAILDPAQGGLTLTLAVPAGIASGAVIARLFGAPVGRWMHAATLPILFVLAAGKLVGVLGATGQGAPSDLPFATAYAGPGPWGSLAADVPSHPAQAYEAALVGLAVVALLAASRHPLIRRRDGAVLYLAIALWSGVRFVVAFAWRDPPVFGPMRIEQVLALVVGGIALAGFVLRARAARRDPLEPSPSEASSPARPERRRRGIVSRSPTHTALEETSDDPGR